MPEAQEWVRDLYNTAGDHSPPDWFGLLRYQRSRGRTGLTIPFLVGATHKPTTYEPIEEGAAFTELTSLLVSFRDVTPHSHCVVMAECVDLLEPIATLYPPGGRADCDPVSDPSSRTTRLYVQGRYFRGARRNIESVIEKLWGLLGPDLMQGQFSFRNGRYATFDSEDHQYLEIARRGRLSPRPIARNRVAVIVLAALIALVISSSIDFDNAGVKSGMERMGLAEAQDSVQ